jgi:hypothetical protein
MPLRKLIAKLQDKWSGRTASRRAPKLKSRRRLELELLETRDLMAVTIAPKILSVTPPNGGSLVETSSPNVIKVTYSEAMNTAEATNAANYLLFGPSGAAVSITSVVEEGATNTYDVTFGANMPAGAYTLFVKGDQVFEATNKLALASPGQLVVANSGAGSTAITTVGVPDGYNPNVPTTLNATQTYALGPNAGSTGAPTPVAVAVGDFNGDGRLDLAIANNVSGGFFTSNEVDIYAGNASGGFSATPTARLLLPPFAGNIVGIVAFSPFGTSNFENIAVLDSTNNVDVFTNTATAGAVPMFNTVAVDPTGATRAVALAAGDFNGDGATDLAVLDAGTTKIDFLPGTFSGTFGAATPFAIPGGLQNPTSIAVGSLKTAVSQDLAVGGSNGVLTLFNNGTFAPATGALITGPLTNITSVAIGNLNGDTGNGAQDVAALSGSSVEVLTNKDDGSGTLNPGVTFPLGAPGGSGPNALALSPQTVGGKADIVVANTAANEVTVLQNTSMTATPTFATAAHYTVDANPVALAIGKLNGDGSPDIVTVNIPAGTGGGTFSVVRNNGNGTYGAPTILTPAAVQPDAIAVGDLNGDGVPDLVVANFSTNMVTVYLASNTTPGVYAAGVTHSITDGANKGIGPVSVTLADLTGTGKLDIITANSGDNTISILASNGDGTFGTVATTVVVGANPTQVVAGKFDNSGHVSLAVSHNGAGANQLLRGVSLLLGNGNHTGNQIFKAVQEILPNVSATAIVAGNFTEANGLPLDLAVADSSNGTVDLLRNNGKGVFTHAVADTYAVGANPSALAVGDFNRDGLEDVVAVSSDANGANQQIAVLLNTGGGFAATLFTPLPFNFPIHSVTVTDLNGDAYPDLVVGLTGASVTGGMGLNPPADANFYTLIGNGDGTFSAPVPYMTGPKGNNTVVAVASDPQVLATTFTLLSDIVNVNLVKNGGFEAHDLNGTSGTFAGWETAQIPNSRGGWYLQSGNFSPLSQTPVPPPSGGTGANVYQAMADQSNLIPLGGTTFGGGDVTFNPNDKSTYSGSNFLFQDITLPASASSLTFSLQLYLNSAAQFTDGETSLDFNNADLKPNQQVRVDFIDPTAPIDTTNVLLSLYQTTSATSPMGGFTITASPAQLAALLNGTNRTVRLRISEVNNQGRLTVGVDNVSLITQYADSTPPAISGPQLRNPGYQVAGPGGTLIFHTTDPTLIGQVGENVITTIGGATVTNFADAIVANIKEVEFSINSLAVDPNFNMAGDTVIGPAGLDATGHFSVDLPSIVPSLTPYTVRARVIDDAGNISGESVFTFVDQAPSVTNWQAVGPGSINTTGLPGARLDATQYNSVVGRINAVLVDPTDATGNTYLTAGDNGGIWRTTDGGVDWTPTTDYLFDPNTGAPINVPIGALGGAINHTNNGNVFVVYAAMGDSDIQPDARGGNGILVSTNGGASWAVAGNSDTVLAGARISKIVVDPNNTNIAYAAVEAGGSSGPGVYKTIDGGLHWANVLSVASIFGPNSSVNPLFAGGTSLASVTDLVINPYDSTEITIGLGNLGLVATSVTAGVYRTNNSGAKWFAVVGGSNAALNDGLPGAGAFNPQTGVFSLTPATSMTIGRITLAYAATGVTNDTSTLYVLITSPPTTNQGFGGAILYGQGHAGTLDEPLHNPSKLVNTPNIYGLYKSGNQVLGITAFTHVQVREQVSPPINPDGEFYFQDINFSNADASNTGVLVVDPTDPNVVYVGGSEEYGLNQSVVGDNIGLVRVDTGNMVDTSYLDPLASQERYLNTGDDVTKREAAYDPPTVNKFLYPTSDKQGYLGEGVSWLDVSTNAFNNTLAAGGDNAVGFGAQSIPPNVTSVAIDAQGRIVFGTEQGIYRLVYQGTGYDFTSGGGGIIAQGGFSGKLLFNAAVPTSVITLTQINGNLQITDLTSVALDPTIPGRLYTTQYNTGAAVTSGSLNYSSSGLASGNINPVPTGGYAGIPDGDRVVVAQPDPTASPGTLNTIYEIFAFGDQGPQENFQIYSSIQGGAFQTITNVPTAGLGKDPAGYMPVLAIDPNKIVVFNQTTGQTDYLDGLLFGTNQIYVSRTSGAQFASLTGGAPLSSRAGSLISAAAFAPSNDQVIWAATNLGEVFVTVLNPANGGYSFQERDVGLRVGNAADIVNSITVDPTNSNIAFITENGGAGSRVFMTTNDGLSWTNITGNLPAGNTYTLVTDPRSQPGSGAPNGRLYVGTDTGVYVSVDSGTHWTALGVGLPHVPVVDIEFSKTLETLVAGTQGRGAFEISTDEIGAHVVSVTPAGPVNGYITPLTSVTITFNKPIASFPPSAVDFITGPGGAVITPLAVTDVSTFPPGFPNPHNVWQITFAPQTADGTYTIQIGPNILDQLGHPMDQNQNAVNGENPGDRFTFLVALNSTDNGQFVTGQYHDALGRPADTNGFITILGPIDAARYAALPSYAFAYVRDVGRPQLIQDLYGPATAPFTSSILGISDLIQRAASPGEISFWQGQFQAGLSYEQMIVSLTSSPTYFAEARNSGNDVAFVKAIYEDLLTFNAMKPDGTPLKREPGTSELNVFVPQLFNAEAVSRTQDARTLLAGQPYQTIFIQSVYKQFLNRIPPAGGAEVNFQLNQFSLGHTQEQIIAEILGSQEYYFSDAPTVVGAPASNATLIRAIYQQLFPGYTVSPGEVAYWVGQINNPSYMGGPNPLGISGEQIANILDTTGLYRFGTTGAPSVGPSSSYNGSVDRAYMTYFGRHATLGELNYFASVYNSNPNFRSEDLIAAILGSPEYFAGHTMANTPLPSQDQQFADALYTSVLVAPNSVAEQTHDLPFLASAELNARNAIGQAIVASGEYHDKLTTYVYQTDLGRAPSPFELSLWRPIVGQSGAVGGPNGDEQLLDAIFSSPEYFLHQTPDANSLHTNDTWLRSLYANLHAPFNAAQEAANLNGVSVAYAAARWTAIRAFQGSAEYVNKITTDAYNLYLGRLPGAGEITYWLNRFQAGATREQEIAQILSSGEYFNRAPLILGLTVQPSNKTFVDAAYLQLFPGYAITQSDENTFVNPLNAGTMTRFQVATTLVGSDLYRFGSPSAPIPNNGFIPRAYIQYLGRAITQPVAYPPIRQPEIDSWRSVYANNPAYLTEDFLATIFDSTEYLVNIETRFPPFLGSLAK